MTSQRQDEVVVVIGSGAMGLAAARRLGPGRRLLLAEYAASRLGPAAESLAVEDSLGRLAVPRLGTPDDIAAAVEFLCSPAAGYITGTDLLIDGGATGLRHWGAEPEA